MLIAKRQIGEQFNYFGQLGLVQLWSGIVLGQHAFECRVFVLNGEHGLVNQLADCGIGAGGVFLEIFPSSTFRHPKHAFG